MASVYVEEVFGGMNCSKCVGSVASYNMQCDAGGGNARPWDAREPGALGSRGTGHPAGRPPATAATPPPAPPVLAIFM